MVVFTMVLLHENHSLLVTPYIFFMNGCNAGSYPLSLLMLGYTINGDYLLIPNKCPTHMHGCHGRWIVDDKQFKMVFPLMYTTLRFNGCT